MAVALYPLFDWLTRRLSPRLAAALVTLLSLIVVVGPVTWLAFGMVSGISSLVSEVDTGQLAVPLPPESVKAWPLIGERLHQLWSFAANNIGVAVTEVAPMLKPVGAKATRHRPGRTRSGCSSSSSQSSSPGSCLPADRKWSMR